MSDATNTTAAVASTPEATTATKAPKIDPKTIPCPEEMSSVSIERTTKDNAGQEVKTSFPFKPYQLLRGPNTGQWYVSFDFGSEKPKEVTRAYIDNLINWLGWDVFVGELMSLFTIRGSKWTVASCNMMKDAKGEEVPDRSTFSMEDYQEFASEYSLRGESKQELLDRRAELFDLMASLDMDKAEDKPEIQACMKELKTIARDLADKKPRTRRTKEQKAADEAAAKSTAANVVPVAQAA